MSVPLRRPVSGGRGLEPPGDELPAEERRAPTQAEWDAMTVEERLRVEEELLTSDSLEQQAQREEAMAEGERHLDTKVEARDTLREFYRRQSPNLFVAADIPVHYPGRKAIRPDLIAVTDVATHSRDCWMVSKEGKGLDLAFEFHHKGNWRKDFVENVERYAELGIREYFAFDLNRREVRGWRLPPGASVYQTVRSYWRRLHSEVLGLDVMVEDGALRFYLDNAELLGGARLVHKLQAMVGDAEQRIESEAQRAEELEQQAKAEARRADAAVEQAKAEARRADTAIEQAKAEGQRTEATLVAFSTAVLVLVAQRGIALNSAETERIRTCKDPSILSRWVARAAEVTAAAELFSDDAGGNPPRS